MFRQMLMRKLLLTCGGVFLACVAAQAQPPGQTLRPERYTAQGPVMYGPVTYYGAQPAYTGYPPRRVGETDIGFVSYYTSAYSPVFFTSINYPGVYGSHTIGVAARSMTTGPRLSFYLPAEGIALRDVIPLGPTRVPDNPTPLTNVANLTVRVPTEDAELYFQGERMTKVGLVRDFVTPELLSNRDYTYDIRMAWRDKDGRELSRERQIAVRAGDKLDIDLMAAEPAAPPEKLESPTLRTMPLPERPRR